jgi:electron transfer flavoprotein beta subunit
VKIVVAIKQVELIRDSVEFTDDSLEVHPASLDRLLNEWDASATEEAARLKDRFSGEVVVVTVGDPGADAALRTCLAMGADRAIRVDAKPIDPISTARLLAPTIAAERADLVLAGVQSSDSGNAATGTALAEFLGLPRVAAVTRLEWDGTGPARVDRELEGGLIEEIEVDTPAMLTIQTGINDPRHANLRAIKRAERTEITVVDGVLGIPAYRVRRMFVPPRGGTGERLSGTPNEVARQILQLATDRLA